MLELVPGAGEGSGTYSSAAALPDIQAAQAGGKVYYVLVSLGCPLEFAHFYCLFLLILIIELTQPGVCTQTHACCLVYI